jgi:hypothetical protein
MSKEQKSYPVADLARDLSANWPNQVIVIAIIRDEIAAYPCRVFIPPLMVANDD